MAIVLKDLKKTDIEKRLTIPSKALRSFPPLRDKHMVDFAVRDEEGGRVWKFRIYTRKKNNNKYLKPVLTKGWREFVCSKQLRVGDRVAFYSAEEQAGAVKYGVKVERPLKNSPSILNHDGDRSMRNIGKEPTGTTYSTDQAMAYTQTDGLRDQTVSTVTSDSTDQAMAYNQTEGLRDQPVSAVTSQSTDQAMAYNQTESLNDLPVTDRVGSKIVEFICLKPHVQVKEPKFIDFFELESQDRRGKDMVESPSTSLTTPFFEFL